MARARKADYGGLLVVMLGVAALFAQCGKSEVPSDVSNRAFESYSSNPMPDGQSAPHDVSKQGSADYRYVLADTLNCRLAPASSASVVSRLADGTRVVVVKQEDGWALLQSPSCWVSSSYLGTSPRTASAPRPPAPSSQSLPRPSHSVGVCPCSGPNVCIGPRGGRYCITAGGNRRYGV